MVSLENISIIFHQLGGAFGSYALTLDDLFADADNANQIEEENNAFVQTWSASNGFLKRSIPDSFYSPKIHSTQVNPARQHYKHLITDRGFEDILRACRPRFRGEYGFGLPDSLTNLIQKSATGKNLETKSQHSQKAILGRDTSLCNMRSFAPNSSRSRYLEWGALDFDDFQYKRVSEPSQAFIKSHPQPSSHTNIGNLDKPLSHSFDISHLQSTLSLDGGGHSMSSCGGDSHISKHRKIPSGPSVALENEETEKVCGRPLGKDCSLSAIQKLMADRDKNIFSITPKDRAKNSDKSHGFVEDSVRNTVKQSLWCVQLF